MLFDKILSWSKNNQSREESSNLTILIAEVGRLFEEVRKSNIILADIRRKINRIRDLMLMTDKEESGDRMYRIWVSRTKECLKTLEYYLFTGDYESIREVAREYKGSYCTITEI